MTSNFRVEVAKEEDLPDIARIIVPAYCDYPIEILLGNINTPEGIEAAGERHRRAWRDHVEETGFSPAIKCIHTDPESGEETMAACALWWIFPERRSTPRKWNYLLRAEWLPEESGEREKATTAFRPMAEMRIKWTQGRGHAILQYMTTDPRFRRKGAATLCVQWGIDRCREFGIPAYLVASEQGKLVYEKMGFEQCDQAAFELDGVSGSGPVMIWWPPGTKPEEKKPLTV